MKRLAQFLFIVSCTSYAYDQSKIKKAAINKELTTRCGTNNCRGPRGKKGPRGDRGRTGRRGPRGRSVCGQNELFLNADMMTHSAFEGPFDMTPFFPYGAQFNSAPINTWRLNQTPFGDDIDKVGANFDIPIDLDRTQPVTVVLHFLIPEIITTGNQAKILVEADYKNSGNLLGVEAPATGFADSQTSPDFTIIIPAPSTPNGTNLVQISTSVSLNPALITGDWAFLQITRILPAANNYDSPLFLSTISVQYTRICS